MKRKRFTGLGALLTLAVFSLVVGHGAEVSAQDVSLKFANYFPPVAQQSKICEDFIKELEALTAGKLKVNYYPGGSLLNGPGMIKGVELGVADIGLAHIQYTPGRMAVTEVCDLPHGYPSSWVGTHVINDFYVKFHPKEWDKVKPLWFFTNGPAILSLTKPVKTMEDLKAVTIRAPGTSGDIIKALGGNAAPIPVVETYDAMSKGVVHGALVSMEAIKTFRFAEVGKFVTNCWNVGATYTFFVVMNKKAYEKLPADVKKAVDKLSSEYVEKSALMWNSIDMEGYKAGKELNVEFIDLPDEEAARWQKAVSPVIDEYVKKTSSSGHSKEEVQSWIDFIKERNVYWTKKQVELGIKSITGPKEIRP